MEAVGGYFGLSLPVHERLHPGALRFSSARSALRYYLEEVQPERLFLPDYYCQTIPLYLMDLPIQIERYMIDDQLLPHLPGGLQAEDAIVLVNYFGILHPRLQTLSVAPGRMIMDHSMALYAPPFGDASIYSPRKFLGVPDGGLLYGTVTPPAEMETEAVGSHILPLLDRAEGRIQDGLETFRKSEAEFAREPVKAMSPLSSQILDTENHGRIRKIRRRNFQFLHQELGAWNGLKLTLAPGMIPHSYPFYFPVDGLRESLVENRIFTPRFWSEVLEGSAAASTAYRYANHLIPLPIDQRYGRQEMERILTTISNFIQERGQSR